MFDLPQVQRSFSEAAGRYEAAAALQHEVEDRLLERLNLVAPFSPARIADLGAGTCRASVRLSRRFPDAQVVALDLAPGMLNQAPEALPRLAGDAHHLPFSDASLDLVFSNLMLQWCSDPGQVLAEARRVLREDGVLTFTTFGPQTLNELRSAWASVDAGDHVSPFTDLREIGDALLALGLSDPVVDSERIVLTYPQVSGLMSDLKSWGAHNMRRDRPRGLTGKGRLAAMIRAYEAFRDADGRIPATFEVVFGFARGAPTGQPRRTSQGEEASFPISHLKRRGRGD